MPNNIRENYYTNKPIIILGAQHSGTRAVVQILKELGSDPGDINNHWKEEKLFLDIHYDLIGKVSKKGWTKTILDIDFITKFIDSKKYLKDIRKKINSSIISHFNDYQNRPWHWKCPISYLFLESWLEIFPEAYYIHIKREDLGVAESLLRRRHFYYPFSAIKFNQIINNRIANKNKNIKNYLMISFENLENEIPKIVKFLPIQTNLEKITNALASIKKRKKIFWNAKYSWRRNIWEIVIRFIILPITKLVYIFRK